MDGPDILSGMLTPFNRLVAMLVLMAALVAAKTNANDWNSVKALRAGTEVRIAASSGSVRGEIDRVTDDTLIVISGTDQQMFDRQQITRVSARLRRRTGRNLLIGLGVGASVGFGIGAALSGSEPFLVGSVAFTPLGAGIGAAVGALIPSGGWRLIYKK